MIYIISEIRRMRFFWFMMNKMISNVLPYFPKGFVWQFSKKYVAGKSIAEAVENSRDLNDKGIYVTVDLLGEFITEMQQAEENRDMYLQIVDQFVHAGIKGSFSIKPTFFGLLLDKEQCYHNIRRVVEEAAKYDSFVRIDMEDSDCTDTTLEIFRRLKQEFPKNIGIVLQAYMRRTLNDIKSLEDLNSKEAPLNIRICKGIYVEPEKIAYKGFQEVRDHYLADLEYMLQNEIFAAIATHDRYLVEGAMELIKKYNVPQSLYEFQMLYGVTPHLRDEIVTAGHQMRIYVPFVKDWFGYCTRLLK